jgi:hypothetical protein
MGVNSGGHPKPYPQRTAVTLFLRVPIADWLRVKVGEKTAFRTVPGQRVARVQHTELPTPIVAYALSDAGEYDCTLMVLEGHRVEPLFNAMDDPEAIAREGFVNHHHFRRYWRKRRGGIYRPMEMVHVWELRLWCEDDFEDMGKLALQRLYGDFYSTFKPRQLQS